MALVKRDRPIRPTPLASWADAGKVLTLPLVMALSLAVPERRWQGLAIRFEKLRSMFSTPPDDAVALRHLAMAGLDNRDSLLRLKALRTEHLLQVMRELLVGWNPTIELIGREHLEQAQRGGRGAVLWIARCGFASLAEKKAFAAHGFAVHHVSRPQHGFSSTRFGMRFLNPLRTKPEYRFAAGRIMIDPANPADSMIAARKLLRGNAFVSILGGITEGQLLVRVKIRDREIQFSSGPPRLAKLADAPLLPVFVHRDPADGVIRVTVEPPIDLSKAGGKEEIIESAAQEFADRHLRFIAAHPLQWRDWRRMKLCAPES